jgi:histone-lysine N-methyltransferase SETD8
MSNQDGPKDNHKVTDYFPVRRSVRKTKKTVMEEKQRTLEQMLRNEVEEGLEVRIFSDKGRGVVTSRPFTKGDFVVEYSGDLIDLNEARRRELQYAQDQNTGCYMYYFKHNDQQYWYCLKDFWGRCSERVVAAWTRRPRRDVWEG